MCFKNRITDASSATRSISISRPGPMAHTILPQLPWPESHTCLCLGSVSLISLSAVLPQLAWRHDFRCALPPALQQVFVARNQKLGLGRRSQSFCLFLRTAVLIAFSSDSLGRRALADDLLRPRQIGFDHARFHCVGWLNCAWCYRVNGMPRSLYIFRASWSWISLCRGTEECRFWRGLLHHEWLPPSRTNAQPWARRCRSNSMRFIR